VEKHPHEFMSFRSCRADLPCHGKATAGVRRRRKEGRFWKTADDAAPTGTKNLCLIIVSRNFQLPKNLFWRQQFIYLVVAKMALNAVKPHPSLRNNDVCQKHD
jgi:hypothetical protein